MIPTGKIAAPENVASLANFLVSDNAGYVNGYVITVDRGQSI